MKVHSWLLGCFLLAVNAHATIWVWLSPEAYVRESTLIAILDIGELHQAFTPEGILIQSARASVEQVIYHASGEDFRLSREIVVYAIEPNAFIAGDRAFFDTALSLQKGRVFAILKQRGDRKFYPFDILSLQEITADGQVRWPVKKGRYDLVPLTRVIEDIKALSATKSTP